LPKKFVQHLPCRPRLYIEEWPALENALGRHDLPYASGNWVPEIARIAGGDPFDLSACDGLVQGKQLLYHRDNQLSFPVTFDQIQKWNPELIILSICGAGALADPALMTKRSSWESLPAIQKGSVRVIDDSLLNRPGPRLVEGAQRLFAWIFEMLH